MSKLPKGFISSTSQEGQEAVERKVLCVTLLSREWRSSTDRDLSTVNRELAIQLAKHPGVQVSVFLPQCTEDGKRNATSHKVQLIEAEEMTTVDSVDWLINIPEDHAMDCIIGHGVHLGRQIPVIQRSHPCKWIQVVHNAHEALAMYKSSPDAIPRGEKMQQTEIELCELADQVVAIGPKLADTYRRFLRSSEKHQDVIDLTPSIFTEFLDVNQAAEERQTFCVLVIGTGDSEDFNLKGYDLAARAIAELKENSYQLKFVCAPKGKGEEIAEKLLKHDIDRSQLIVRSFNESRETLSRLFCEVDLAIMPSRSEGFGLTALEALSAGLPVLVSGNSGLGEALMKVPNGSNCVVDSEDPKYWASKIKAVREKDRDVRLAESKLLREKYLEKYSWEKPCGVLVEKIQNLVTGSFVHREPPSFLQYTQSPFPAGRQTPAQTYQTSPPQSSSGHGRPRSSLENNQSRFLAGPQTPAQTYQTSHPHSSFSHDRPPSLLEHNTGPQTPVQTYPTSHPPQSSTGYWPSSMEYSRFPSVLAGQSHEGPSYQTWHSPAMFMTGGYSQLPFHAATQTHGEPTYTTSHHPQTMLMTGGYSQLPFHAATQTHGEPTFPTSHHPQKASPANLFDVKTCQRKLAERYQKTAKVPTTAWSSVLQVDLEQIYTRLSWVKQEQTTTGPSQKELNHYTELFTEKTKNGDVAKRILVQGETGIGKTTFVKKLLVDWSNLKEEKRNEERIDALRKFDLVVSINLKEVSKCQTFKEVISRSRLFPEDDEKLVEDLLCYIRKNQDKVLLVFDGYDEYRTSSEAEERYGSRDNSPIFQVLHGSILRECTVLVTTRSSRADEIRGPADIQAEITGFNMADREDFIRKMLGSQTEVDDLLTFLCTSGMEDLAKVPLLSLFFCLLWKEEKQKLVELSERKAKLYQAIVKHILQHSHRRHSFSKASKLNEADYDEILAEIGKVALAGLRQGDLVFEFGQLPEKMRGDEGVIVGLFQFSEYGPSLEPMEMVSFIHKSIQEYLAAWYLIYSCVPKGNLGEVEQYAATLKDCEALGNVFQFVSGLSEVGAKKVLEHLKSVRISDPTLDLSKTIPDLESKTDAPPCEVTDRHVRFSYLIYDCVLEVQSKAELLSHFLDCTGGVVLVTSNTLLSELIPEVNVLIKLPCNLVFIPWEEFVPWSLFSLNVEDTITYKSLEFLDCLQLSVRVTESSDVLKVEDLIRKLQPIRFKSMLCLRNGRFQFYITELSLERDDHARLFTESTSISTPPDTGSLYLQQLCLRFLTFLCFRNLSDQTVKALGAVIRSCEHLYMINIVGGEESLCYLLDQVPNPSKCSVAIGTWFVHPDATVDSASEGAVQLASLLPRFISIIDLYLDVRDCCAAALNILVAGIAHKTVKNLMLSGIKLTLAAAEALGRSLPEMSSLQDLQLYGMDGSILQAEEMKAVFGRFNKTLPLRQLTFSSFSEISCLAPLNQSLRFFPNLRVLHLEKLNLNEHDLCGLLESWSFICNLTELHVRGDQPGQVYCYPLGIEKSLTLGGVNLTSAVATTLGRILPKMSSLQVLQLYGMDGSILQAEEMKALFGRFDKTLPLRELTFSSFSEISCLAPLNQSLRFFPNLRALHLEKLNLNDHDLCGLLESCNVFHDLTELCILGNQPGRVYCHTCGTSVRLTLDGVNLTLAVATTLGRILPEMSSLQTLKVTGVDGSSLQTKELEALFGKLHKPLPLHELDITDYDMKGSLAPLIKSLRFFPNVRKLVLDKLNMDEDDKCGLLESLKFIPHLTSLEVQSRSLVYGDYGTPTLTLTSHSSTLGTFKSLNLHGIRLTPATTASLGRSLPEMSSLETLELAGHQDGRILQAEVIKALFGGFSKIMRLSDLNVFPGLNVTGSIAPLTNVFCFFPNLARLCLVGLHMDEHNLCGLLESLQFTPKLMELRVCDGGVGRAHCSTTIANPLSGFTYEALRKLNLIYIDVTPAVAVVLGRFLPEMVSLQNLNLQEVRFPENVEGMEALFGKFNKKVPLVELSLSNSSFMSCPLGPAAKSFRFFPDLEQLRLEGFVMNELNLCALLESLRFIPNLKNLNVNGCAQFFFPVRVDTMLSITNKTPEQLKLDEVSFSPAAAALVGRSLPEMSSQETVALTGMDGSISQGGEMEALFDGFRTLRNSSLRVCLTTFCKGFHALPNLKTMRLTRLSLSELGQCYLLESLRFIPGVRELSVTSNRHDQGRAHRFSMQDRFSSFTLEAHERLHLVGINLTPAAATALGRSLPEMSSLQVLQLTGVYGSILQAEEIEALFGGFNKTLPLCKFTFSGFSVRGRLAPLIKSLQFFANLKELKLEGLAIDEHDQCGLLKSFKFKSWDTSRTLHVRFFGENFRYRPSEFKTSVSHEHGLVFLDGINLTLAVANELGQLLREIPSLQDLELEGEGSILGAEEMEALFGAFNEIMPLCRLTFFDFGVGGSFAPLTKSFRFFPNLTLLLLEILNMGEHDLCGLLESFQFIPNLQKLSLAGNPLGHAVRSIVPHVIDLKKLQYLWIGNTGHSEEDLIYVRDSVQEARSEIQVDFTAVFVKSFITRLVY